MITGKGKTGMCPSCNAKLRMGKLNPNYKEGRYSDNKLKLKCKICGKLITGRGKTEFCQPCSKKGKNHHMWGKHHTEATKQKQSELAIKRFQNPKEREKVQGKNNGMFGKKLKPETILKISGKNNHNYIHGNGYAPYTKKFRLIRNEILERDNYTCQKCGLTQEEHINKWARDIEIHHIDYNRENCEKINLITLCHKCNMVANFNRDYYYAFYTYIIENKIYSLMSF